MENTQDLSKLGYREIDQLAELLKLYANAKWEKDSSLNGNVKWEYNPNSDNLFLVDEDYNVAMDNGNGKLENWVWCSYCGAEDFRSEIEIDDDGNCEVCAFIKVRA